MIAFHGENKIKEKYLQRLRDHADADEIIKGTYWENGKGCAVGCTIHSAKHAAYEDELGIPRIIAYLEDRIFENLPNELAKTWPIRFLEAIPIGANLELIWPKFAHWLIADPTYGVIRFNKDPSIFKVIDLFQSWIDGNKPDIHEWESAASAASASAASASAASAAAANAATAAAASASADAGASAAYAATATACAAANAYADDAYVAIAYASAYAADAYASADAAAKISRENHFVVISEKLLQLLNER